LILRRLGVCFDLTVLGVHTRKVLIVTQACLKDTLLRVVGCVIGTADTVETVFAKMGGVRALGVTDFEAEAVQAYEVVPFDNLSVAVVVCAEGVGEHDATHWVSTEVSTVRV